MTQRDVKDSLGAQGISTKPSEAPKRPKISWTSPPGQREDYKKYSAEASAVNSELPLIFTDFSSGKKISGKINQGGHLLRIKTTDGDITLRKLSSDLILSTKGKDNYFLFD